MESLHSTQHHQEFGHMRPKDMQNTTQLKYVWKGM